MKTPTRTFTDKPAVRAAVPLLVGLAGPSGCGKTYSALRLATGMQTVTGGEIFMIDTEARRGLHYADQFKFRHVPFDPPFSPLDYMAAIEHCVKQGAKIVVVDSMSHEHEGPGGVLEWHAQEMGGNFKKSMLAWQKPKAARRRLLNTIVQLGINMIFCFRAKEKLKMSKRQGEEPTPLGWQPIAGQEFVYEMTTAMLLPPGSQGVPDWHPEHDGERSMIKLPAQFKALAEYSGPLTEKIGENMARWAAGGSAVKREEPGPARDEPEPPPEDDGLGTGFD